MGKIQQACDDDIQGNISIAKQKNEMIMRKLITVFGKFEEYLATQTGAAALRAEHETLNDEYASTFKKISDPRLGLLKKLRDLSKRIQLSLAETNEPEI